MVEWNDAKWTTYGDEFKAHRHKYGENFGCSDDELKAVKAANTGSLKSEGHHLQVGVLAAGVVAMIAAAFI